MKKSYLILIISIFSYTFLMAQPPKGGSENRERIEALRVSFITSELNLSSEEAQNFWPIFNAFQSEKEALFKEYNPRAGQCKKNLSEVSKEEANILINNEIACQKKEVEITQKYISKLKTVLSVEKVAVLLALEHKFKRMLFEKMKE